MAELSKRDELAARALTGLLGGSAFQRADRRHAAMAHQAYEFADAMLKASEQPPRFYRELDCLAQASLRVVKALDAISVGGELLEAKRHLQLQLEVVEEVADEYE